VLAEDHILRVVVGVVHLDDCTHRCCPAVVVPVVACWDDLHSLEEERRRVLLAIAVDAPNLRHKDCEGLPLVARAAVLRWISFRLASTQSLDVDGEEEARLCHSLLHFHSNGHCVDPDGRSVPVKSVPVDRRTCQVLRTFRVLREVAGVHVDCHIDDCNQGVRAAFLGLLPFHKGPQILLPAACPCSLGTFDWGVAVEAEMDRNRLRLHGCCSHSHPLFAAWGLDRLRLVDR